MYGGNGGTGGGALVGAGGVAATGLNSILPLVVALVVIVLGIVLYRLGRVKVRDFDD